MEMNDNRYEIYQQMILEHNKKPRNFHTIEGATHQAEGYNPLCGDHLHVYMNLNDQKIIEDMAFVGEGCAISKASASLMTSSLKGKTQEEAKTLFDQFHRLIKGELKPDRDPHTLGKLTVFSGIWQYPARVKCASLCWHAMKAAMEKVQTVSTE